MKVLSPLEITSLTTTTVPENDYPEYSAGTTYAIEARVIVVAEHNIYESLADNNTGNTPSTSPSKWILVGKTNAYKCVDEKVSTQTIKADSITMTLPVGKATSIAFLNVECVTLRVEIYEGATQIYDETIDGLTRETVGWFSYFFGEFEFKNFFLFEHLYNPTATYKITLTGDICKLGVMLKGNIVDSGCTLVGAGMGFYDYSKKEVDEWGETYLKEGNYRDYFRGEVMVAKDKLSYFRKFYISRRGKLSLFIPSDDYDLTVYGYVVEPEMIWDQFDKSVYTLDIQGVI